MSEEVKYTNTNLGTEDGIRFTVSASVKRLRERGVPHENAAAIAHELEHVCIEAFMNGVCQGFITGVIAKPGDGDFECVKNRIERINPAITENEHWARATSAASSDIYDQGLIDGWNAATKGDPTDPKYVQAKAIVQALATPTITS